MSVKTAIKTKTVKISTKGQITLPKSFLHSLNINYGDFIEIKIDADKLEIFSHKQDIKNKIKNIFGSVKPKIKTNLSLEEQIEEAKEEHFNQKFTQND